MIGQLFRPITRECARGRMQRITCACSRAFSSKVCVGLSGGVDSSVVALLGKKAGLDIHAVFMKNWDSSDERGTSCQFEEDWDSARRVADHLSIPISRVDLSKEYWNDVFEPFLEDYSNNFTPNPDVGCNRHIKFGAFMRWCVRELEADIVATGHYARLSACPPSIATSLDACSRGSDTRVFSMPTGDLEQVLANASCDWAPSELRRAIPAHIGSPPQLLQGVDKGKDQSYFLAQVDRGAWARTWMPLGEFHKQDVRRLAHAAGLPTATRKDSVGICFIGKRKMGDFLPQYIPMKQGNFRLWPDEPLSEAAAGPPDSDTELNGAPVSLPSLGAHSGVALYTEGQAAGIGGLPRKAYVARKGVDVAATVRGWSTAGTSSSASKRSGWAAGSDIVVVQARTHPLLYTRSVFLRLDRLVGQLAGQQWERAIRSEGGLAVAARFRNLQPLVRGCNASVTADGVHLRVELPMPHRALSPGQVAVLHLEQEHWPSSAEGLLDYAELPVLASAPIDDTGPSLLHEGRLQPMPAEGQTSLFPGVLRAGSHPLAVQPQLGDTDCALTEEDMWID